MLNIIFQSIHANSRSNLIPMSNYFSVAVGLSLCLSLLSGSSQITLFHSASRVFWSGPDKRCQKHKRSSETVKKKNSEGMAGGGEGEEPEEGEEETGGPGGGEDCIAHNCRPLGPLPTGGWLWQHNNFTFIVLWRRIFSVVAIKIVTGLFL